MLNELSMSVLHCLVFGQWIHWLHSSIVLHCTPRWSQTTCLRGDKFTSRGGTRPRSYIMLNEPFINSRCCCRPSNDGFIDAITLSKRMIIRNHIHNNTFYVIYFNLRPKYVNTRHNSTTFYSFYNTAVGKRFSLCRHG